MTHERLSRPEDLERLLERAERDPAASAELDFLADLVAAVELERPLLEAELVAAERRARVQRPPWIWIAVAAALLVAAGLAFWLRTGQGQPARPRDLALCEAPRYIPALLRSPEVADQEAFPRAMEPYTRGDFAAARASLQELLAREPQQDVARFYLAAAEEQLGVLDAAEGDYRRVASEADGYLAEHALWRLANLLLARDDVARARVELERLRALDGAFVRNASELLERSAGL